MSLCARKWGTTKKLDVRHSEVPTVAGIFAVRASTSSPMGLLRVNVHPKSLDARNSVRAAHLRKTKELSFRKISGMVWNIARKRPSAEHVRLDILSTMKAQKPKPTFKYHKCGRSLYKLEADTAGWLVKRMLELSGPKGDQARLARVALDLSP